jgi:hypothetical protein
MDRTAILRTHFKRLKSDANLPRKRSKSLKRRVEIQDKEQMLYYEHFRKVFGKPKTYSKGSVESPNAHRMDKQKSSSAKSAEPTNLNLSFLFVVMRFVA